MRTSLKTLPSVERLLQFEESRQIQQLTTVWIPPAACEMLTEGAMKWTR
jgi:hypothetical protein